MTVIKRSELNVGLEEALLRLQGSADEIEGKISDLKDILFLNLSTYDCMFITVSEYRTTRSEEPFRELSKKSAQLKRILSRIPDEIIDRKTFLETIK